MPPALRGGPPRRRSARAAAACARAAGRILDHAALARSALPPSENSAIHGHDTGLSDPEGAGPRLPTFRGRLVACDGHARAREPGTAVRIFTGTPIPRGADAAVPRQEVGASGATIVPEGGPATGGQRSASPAGSSRRARPRRARHGSRHRHTRRCWRNAGFRGGPSAAGVRGLPGSGPAISRSRRAVDRGEASGDPARQARRHSPGHSQRGARQRRHSCVRRRFGRGGNPRPRCPARRAGDMRWSQRRDPARHAAERPALARRARRARPVRHGRLPGWRCPPGGGRYLRRPGGKAVGRPARGSARRLHAGRRRRAFARMRCAHVGPRRDRPPGGQGQPPAGSWHRAADRILYITRIIVILAP